MTWREDLRRVSFGERKLIGASFRGVPFFVESSDRSGGRRIVVHEFPLRSQPFVEDLDQRARRFRVDGYVIGDDYLTQRDALLAALEDTAGPGELVHPYHGVRRAICDTVSVRETRQEGGMAMFAIDFVETPAQAPTPTEQVDQASEVSSRADAAVVATQAQLEQDFDATGMPEFALASAETALQNAATALQDKLSPIVTDTQEAALLAAQVRVLTSEAASLVRRPADVLDEFRTVITDLENTATSAPGDVMNALIEAYSADLGPQVLVTTPTRERELANQAAIIGALRSAIAIEAARLAPRVPFVSTDDATAAREQVAELLDDQAQAAGDTAYPALVTLRSDLLRAVPGSTDYPRVVTVTRRVATPSLLLSYQLYGDVDRESDVIARNGVAHPGFIAGDLKVLTDGG